ncbi:hypothetical protein DFH06DRAFT_974340, partial [Mycena polygramma]
METIFSASEASHCRSAIVARPQATNYPSLVVRDQTVVAKWSWVTREAHIKLAEAEQSRHCHEEIDNFVPERHKASLQEFTADDGDYERRALRIIVEQELQPLTKLTDPDELAKVFKGIVQCHHRLYETVKILHRDISVSNLM